MAVQLEPPSVLLNTPPPPVPAYSVLGVTGSIAKGPPLGPMAVHPACASGAAPGARKINGTRTAASPSALRACFTAHLLEQHRISEATPRGQRKRSGIPRASLIFRDGFGHGAARRN